MLNNFQSTCMKYREPGVGETLVACQSTSWPLDLFLLNESLVKLKMLTQD